MCQDWSWVDSVWFRACFVTTGDTKVASSDSCYKLWCRVAVFYNMYKCGSFLSYVCDVKVVVSRFYRWYSAVWLLLWYKSSICETVWPLPWYKGLWHRRTERMCILVEAGLVRRRAVSTWSIDFLSLGQTLRNTEIQNYTIAQMHFYTLVKMECQFDPSNFFPSQWRTLQRVSKLNTHGYCAWQNGQRGSQTNI